ncbi:MAG: hypothetical protein AB1700_02075 [Bacillota bacterium]
MQLAAYTEERRGEEIPNARERRDRRLGIAFALWLNEKLRGIAPVGARTSQDEQEVIARASPLTCLRVAQHVFSTYTVRMRI